MKHLTHYQCTHFRIEELVPQRLFQEFRHRQDVLWGLFNPYLLWTADAIRDHYKCSMVCNDWLWGGRFQGRGYRPPDYETGARHSTHRRGCGLDLWPDASTTNGVAIRDDIIAYPWWEPFQFITCVETNVRHLHFDLRNHDRETHGILVVHP